MTASSIGVCERKGAYLDAGVPFTAAEYSDEQIAGWRKVTDAVQVGVAVVEGTWWGLSAPDGLSINELTAQTLTDLGGGSTFHNTRIRVQKAEG